MGEQCEMRAPAHYLQVNLDDSAEAEYWSVVLDVDREKLIEAVVRVGTDARDVGAYLRAGRR
jgi:hypothetical protein